MPNPAWLRLRLPARPPGMHAMYRWILALLLASMSLGAAAAELTDEKIEKSFIIAPKVVGAFSLLETKYDPTNKAAGVMLRYQPVPEPGVYTDVFVYPAGQGQAESILKSGMREFRTTLHDAERAGYVGRMKIRQDRRFDLQIGEAKAETSGDTPIDNIAKGMLAAQKISGHRLLLDVTPGKENTPFRSVGYLFYKQLYFYKLRISLPQSAIGAEEFDELTEHAARSLIPAIDVMNIGGCGNKSIYIAPKANDEQATTQLIGQLMTISADNCKSELDEKELEGKRKQAEIVQIDFDATDWKTR